MMKCLIKAGPLSTSIAVIAPSCLSISAQCLVLATNQSATYGGRTEDFQKRDGHYTAATAAIEA